MPRLHRFLIAVLAVLGATAAQAQTDDLKRALSGKTLVAETAQFKLAANGGLSGKAGKGLTTDVKGAWTVRDGKFCRTLEAPANLAGTACQKAVLNGDGTVTIDGTRGPVTYRIE